MNSKTQMRNDGQSVKFVESYDRPCPETHVKIKEYFQTKFDKHNKMIFP